MTEQTHESPTDGQEQAPETPKAPEVDWKAKAREWEKRAKANATAAEQLQALEDAKKTEIERIAERATLAERERDETRVELTRYRLAAKYGLDEGDLDFIPAGSDEDMEARAKRLSDRLKAQAPTQHAPGPRPDLSQGPRGDMPLNGDPLLNDIKLKLGIR